MPKIMKGNKVLTSEPVIAEVIYTNQLINEDETVRQTQESNRATSENGRVTDESTRQTQEATRQSQETTRQNYYNAYKLVEVYNPVTPYIVSNKVTYQGGTYQCILACTGVSPTYNTNNANWICIAAKGTDGTGIGDMLLNVYDTQNKATDIFTYTDNKVGDTTQLPTVDKTNVVNSIKEVSGQLEAMAINPESFEGTDAQKLQSAFDAAITQKKPLCISKTYNIGVNTIVINKGSDVREPLFVFGGGKIIKDASGYIFMGSVISISDLFFNNIWFEGVTGLNVDVFNCENANLIRINTKNCYFKQIRNIFYSNNYVQDINMDGDTIVKCSGAVFDIQGGFVISMKSIRMEVSTGQVVKHGGTGTFPSIYNFSVKDSVIEGFTQTIPLPLFDLKSGSFIFDNNYFESVPNGVIKLTGYSADLTAISNTLLGQTNSVPFVVLPGVVGKTDISGNITPLSPTVDATSVTSGVVIVSNNTSNFVDIDPQQRIYNKTKDLVNNKVIKLGNNFKNAIITKSIPDTTKVNLLTFSPHINTGCYVTVRGGGIQGNIGVFGVNKTFKVSRYNSVVTVTTATTEAWGDSNLQYENIFLEIDGVNLILRANSRNATTVSYELDVEIHGYTDSITIN